MVLNAVKVLREYSQQVGLKNTRQRDIIAEEFFKRNAHLSADEVLEYARKIDARVSLATVYRTLKLLQDCGLARVHHFGDGQARYEPVVDKREHHDHLICTKCGKIVEFFNQKIEQLQELVAKEHGFLVTNHKMELYGLCRSCGLANQGYLSELK